MEPPKANGVSPRQDAPAPEQAPEKKPGSPPPEEDQAAFEKALDKTGPNLGTPEPPAGNLGSLAGMMSAALRNMNATPPAAPEAAPTPPSFPAVHEIADRILVAAPQPGDQRQEVRITLKEDVLPQTEIQIVRDGDSLTVKLTTRNADANLFLSAHQAELKERLGQRLNIDINLSLEYDQRDGRSRGQRNLYEEMEGDR
jgi:type III secretion system needle length determinant